MGTSSHKSPRSYQVRPDAINTVKAEYRKRYDRESDLAKDAGISETSDTVNKFLNGKKVSRKNFWNLCDCLELEWEEVALLEETSLNPENIIETPAPREFQLNPYAYIPKTWVGREQSGKLGESLRGECRILIVTGITGQGKTALAECIAVTELAQTGLKPIRIDFDRGSWQQGFDGFITQFWETLTGQPLPPQTPSQQGFNRVVAKLRKEGYLLLFDSTEKLLQPKTGRTVDSVFVDEGWWRLFAALLVGESCQSRVIITSQDRLTQFEECKQRHFWQEEALEGLAETEQQQLFRQWFENRGVDFPEDDESLGYLQQIGKAFEGHPLVIEVVVSELLAKPFHGNVQRYWRKFGKSFMEEESRNRNQPLERSVKKEYDMYYLG